jgi:hypothetical protein
MPTFRQSGFQNPAAFRGNNPSGIVHSAKCVSVPFVCSQNQPQALHLKVDVICPFSPHTLPHECLVADQSAASPSYRLPNRGVAPSVKAERSYGQPAKAQLRSLCCDPSQALHRRSRLAADWKWVIYHFTTTENGTGDTSKLPAPGATAVPAIAFDVNPTPRTDGKMIVTISALES